MLLKISVPSSEEEVVLIVQRVDRGNEVMGTRGLSPGDSLEIELPLGSQLLVEEGVIMARYSS
jgi:NAD(P)H-flavin reductase